MEDMRSYFEMVLDSFMDDPADTDYQRGYLAAMKDAFDYFEEVTEIIT